MTADERCIEKTRIDKKRERIKMDEINQTFLGKIKLFFNLKERYDRKWMNAFDYFWKIHEETKKARSYKMRFD